MLKLCGCAFPRSSQNLAVVFKERQQIYNISVSPHDGRPFLRNALIAFISPLGYVTLMFSADYNTTCQNLCMQCLPFDFLTKSSHTTLSDFSNPNFVSLAHKDMKKGRVSVCLLMMAGMSEG